MYTDKDKMILDLKEENLQLYRELYEMNDRVQRAIKLIEDYDYYIPEDDIRIVLDLLRDIISDKRITINNTFTIEE